MVSEIDALESLILVLNAGEQSDVLRRFGNTRRYLTELRSRLVTKKEILTTLVKEKIVFVIDYTNLYLRDVLDNLATMLATIDGCADFLNNLNQTYLAKVSIEVAEASNRMNDVMKKFSAVATVMLPLTLVAGLWGMNVKVPGQVTDETTSYTWFFSIVGAMVAFCIIAAYFFYKKRMAVKT